MLERLRKLTWPADAIQIWLGLPTALSTAGAFIGGVLEGWGVTVSFLFALTALPLALLSCLLLRYWRDIGRAIGVFLGVVPPSDASRERPLKSKEQLKIVDIWDAIAEAQVLIKDLSRTSFERAAQLDEIHRDLLVLLHYCAHNLTYQMLLAVRQRTPPELREYHEETGITEEWIDEQTRIANEYVSHVWMELGATRWGADLRSLERRGEAEGNRYVSDLPKEERPSHIDPYKFQQYAIAKTKYDFVTRFLSELENEERDNLQGYLDSLRERLRKRAGD